MTGADASPRIRVVMVSRRVHPAHGPGGLERHVYELACHLARAGVDIDLVTETPLERDAIAAASTAFPPGVAIHWVRGGRLPIGRRAGTIVLDRITNYPWWALRAARWLLDEQRYRGAQWDVVHVHGMAGWGVARAVRAGALTTPILLTTHGLEEFRSPQRLKHWGYWPFRACVRTVAEQSAAVVTTDVSLKPVVEEHLTVPVNAQIVIPNAVDADRCVRLASPDGARALLAKLGLDQPTPLFVSVGRVAPNKGFDLVPRALAQAASALPERWAWILVGDGADLPRVNRAVKAMNLESRCRIAGRLSDDDLHGLLSIADWFVHPTLYEGSSLATLEAMAHGLPVIASRTGGLPDKVVDGETGFLVPPGDVDALAAAFRRTMDADRASMGDAGRRLCQSRFGWPAVAARYRRLYEDLRADDRAAPSVREAERHR
jgi:glycosyltransferase involved in cell wall biosynthesis